MTDGGTVPEDQTSPGPELGLGRQVSQSKTEASPHHSSCIPPPALWHVTQINAQQVVAENWQDLCVIFFCTHVQLATQLGQPRTK